MVCYSNVVVLWFNTSSTTHYLEPQNTSHNFASQRTRIIPQIRVVLFSRMSKKLSAILSDLDSALLSSRSQLSSPCSRGRLVEILNIRLTSQRTKKLPAPLFSRCSILLSEWLFATTIGSYSPLVISRGNTYSTRSPYHLLSFLTTYLTIPNSPHVSNPIPLSIQIQIPIPTLP